MYSACGAVLLLREVGWCASMYWHGWSGFALALARNCPQHVDMISHRLLYKWTEH